MNSHGLYTLLLPLRENNFGAFDSVLADLARPKIFAGAAPALEAGRLLFTIRYHSSAARRSAVHYIPTRPDPTPTRQKNRRPEGRPRWGRDNDQCLS